MSDRPHRLLVVEDNPDDFFILRRALKNAGVTDEIDHVSDGESAIRFLEPGATGELNPAATAQFPTIVLLDLKLPRTSGLDVLKWIRGQEKLAGLSVIMFSTSQQKSDVTSAYHLGANAYLVKPPTVSELVEMLQAMDRFWLKYNCSLFRVR